MFVVIVYMPHERRRWELILTLNLDLIFVCPEAFLNLRKKISLQHFMTRRSFLVFPLLVCSVGQVIAKKKKNLEVHTILLSNS